MSGLGAWLIYTFRGKIFRKAREGERSQSIPAVALRTHDEVAEAVTDTKLEMRLAAVEKDMVTYWRRVDELRWDVRILSEKVAGLPTSLAANEMERRILDAIHAEGMASAVRMAEHIRDYHSRATQ